MNERIVFQGEGQTMAVVIPCDCGIPVLQIGLKDVPDGVPFWIVDASDIPEDRVLRNAWDLDVAAMGEPHGVGDNSAFAVWWNEKLAAELALEQELNA
jgi:hypothetical protein